MVVRECIWMCVCVSFVHDIVGGYVRHVYISVREVCW